MSTDVSYNSGRLTVTRIFEAPREAVFDAWINTSKVNLWWGCADATEVESEIEPKVGGQFRYDMTIRNSIHHPVNGLITEFEPPALLAYEAIGPEPDVVTTVRIVFIVHESGTKVQLTQDNIADNISQFVRVGWAEGFEKLAAFLADTLLTA